MSDKSNVGSASAQLPEGRKRFRSEIEFPYSDMESAVELAQAILSNAGTSCETDELAVWMNQTATGGTFRTRVGAARLFGLIETSGGRAALTQLGRDALDNSGSERAARVAAFLNVELFRVMYEQNKGNALPPPPAIERQMEGLGVSPKQKERARQTFMRSAEYAGFIDATSGRFVKPGLAQIGESARPQEKLEDSDRKGGGNDGLPPGLHPFVQGLLKELPPAGDAWPETQRKLWLDTAASIFKMIYKDEPTSAKRKLFGNTEGAASGEQ